MTHASVAALATLMSIGGAIGQPADNLLHNGSFEHGQEGWTVSICRAAAGNPYASSGHAAVEIVAGGADGGRSARITSRLAHDNTDPRACLLQQIANLKPGYYRLALKYRLIADPAAGFGTVHSDWNGGRLQLRLAPQGDGWQELTRVLHARGGAAPWRVLLYLKGKGTIWYDDVHLVAITREEYMEANKLGPRDYHIETTLVQDGRPSAVIVCGRPPVYAKIATQVQTRIEQLTGVALPIEDAETVATADVLARANAIVLGNLATSKFVERLYWEWYTLLDLWYPGRGGHVLRTLHDPYGTGRNVILLGGSDDQGVREAADAFCEALQQADPLAVGRLMQIRLGEAHKLPPQGEWTDPRLRLVNLRGAVPPGYTDLSRLGLAYHYSGDEELAQRFRQRALDTDELVHADHYRAHMHALVWDLIEESPVFSDEDRERITGKLLQHARGQDGTAGVGGLLSYATGGRLLNRHVSMQAICTLVEGRYFGKHWPSDEWDGNLDAVRTYFDRQMTCGKANSDLGGRGIYTYFECAIIPALLLGDRRLIDSGAMRHYGELCLMHCNNNGYMPESGQGGHTSYPTFTFYKCAALLDDGSFLATMKRREEAERTADIDTPTEEFTVGQAWATGVEPRPMGKMIGVYHLPLTPWEWEVRGQAVPIAKSFDKLTMRSGFERDDQYLLLDGLYGGPDEKPWSDVNSIVEFGQNGRTFLVSDIGGQNAVNHNVVTVSKDGLGRPPARVASLEALANLPGFGYSHSRIEEHAFSSWSWHIFWRRGRWFVVRDELAATGEGQYAFECHWRVIGEPESEGSTLTAAVWDWADDNAPRDRLTIKNAEGWPVRHSEQLSGLFGPPDRKRWERYTKQPGINRFRQVAVRDMAPGDRQVFTNLIYVGGDRAPAEHDIAPLDDGALLLTGDDLAYLGVPADGQFERGKLKLRAEAFCAGPASIGIVGGDLIEWDGQAIRASRRCNMEYSPESGRLTVEAPAPLTIAAARDVHVQAGTHELDGVSLDGFAKGIRRQLQTEARAARAPTSPPPDLAAPKPAPAWRHAASAEVLRLHAGDVDGDGSDEVCVGLADGRVVVLSGAGDPKWEFSTGGPVRALAHATLAGQRAVLAGSDDEHVYALNADGADVLWRRKCRLSPGYVSWWTTSLKAKVQAILPADLDGDGEVEIICGTGGGCVETFDADGASKWLTPIRWGIPDRLVVLPGADGPNLLVSNGWSSCGSTVWRLAADGKLLSANAYSNQRSSWDMTTAPGLLVADLEGDGRLVAAVGRAGGYNEVALHDAASGERRWLFDLPDAVSALATCDVNGDGGAEVLVGSPSGWLCAFSAAGEQLYARMLPHEIRALLPVGDALWALCADRGVYRLSLEGDITARYELSARPLDQLVIAGDHVIAADTSGSVVALPAD